MDVESEWTPGAGDEQGGLACCNSWGRRESDTTEQLNWTELNLYHLWASGTQWWQWYPLGEDMFCMPLQAPLQPSLALSAQKTSPGLEEILLQTLLLGARGSCHSRRLQEGKCVRGGQWSHGLSPGPSPIWRAVSFKWRSCPLQAALSACLLLDSRNSSPNLNPSGPEVTAPLLLAQRHCTFSCRSLRLLSLRK